ncbi:MAG: hypothetical protein DRO11_10505 [Methanobacteriota archaeon]|nr:MAG: hypothetical protein DRO11_10505 [Euryarchaeota archaeon]
MMTKSYGDNKAFLDLLLNCLVGFVFLFMVAFSQIAPDETEAQIKTKAEYVITLTWPIGDPSDVDMWLEDPAGNLISFKGKEAGLTHLDRDDLGGSGDSFMLPDGRIIRYEYNQEIMTIRGFIPGEWTINIHMYNKKKKEPTVATVRIDKLNPKVVTIFNEKFALEKHWQEITVIRFTMKSDGELIGIHKLPVSLIQKHPDLRNRTAGELQRNQVVHPPSTSVGASPHHRDAGISGSGGAE